MRMSEQDWRSNRHQRTFQSGHKVSGRKQLKLRGLRPLRLDYAVDRHLQLVCSPVIASVYGLQIVHEERHGLVEGQQLARALLLPQADFHLLREGLVGLMLKDWVVPHGIAREHLTKGDRVLQDNLSKVEQKVRDPCGSEVVELTCLRAEPALPGI